MAAPYFSSTGNTLTLGTTSISGITQQDRQKNAELREFSRFMANGPHDHGSIDQFATDSPLDLLNRGKIQSVIYERAEIPLPNIDDLKKESYVVYDDSSLEHDQVVDMMKVKAGLSYNFPDLRMKANLLTMMLPSCMYGRDGANATMTKVKILNYTYLNFNRFRSLDDSIRQNVKSMIRLNLLTVCYEALQQQKPVPFIINPPGAFIRNLKTKEKVVLAQIVAESLSELCGDEKIEQITKNTISEWILLNPDFWRSRPAIPHTIPLHFVQADVCHVAQELWSKHGVMCPLPMMGDSMGPIGNGALGDHAESALDEFLFRICGGIHGLVGSLRYNPDIRIIPLSRVVAEMMS